MNQLDPNYDPNHCYECGDSVDREMGINISRGRPYCHFCYRSGEWGVIMLGPASHAESGCLPAYVYLGGAPHD